MRACRPTSLQGVAFDILTTMRKRRVLLVLPARSEDGARRFQFNRYPACEADVLSTLPSFFQSNIALSATPSPMPMIKRLPGQRIRERRPQ